MSWAALSVESHGQKRLLAGQRLSVDLESGQRQQRA
jgi:cold shock CspA family protein